jgi:hypothetical protein
LANPTWPYWEDDGQSNLGYQQAKPNIQPEASDKHAKIRRESTNEMNWQLRLHA